MIGVVIYYTRLCGHRFMFFSVFSVLSVADFFKNKIMPDKKSCRRGWGYFLCPDGNIKSNQFNPPAADKALT
jgi:hypothetical protein